LPDKGASQMGGVITIQVRILSTLSGYPRRWVVFHPWLEIGFVELDHTHQSVVFLGKKDIHFLDLFVGLVNSIAHARPYDPALQLSTVGIFGSVHQGPLASDICGIPLPN
jgi:hypothetical protein